MARPRKVKPEDAGAAEPVTVDPAELGDEAVMSEEATKPRRRRRGASSAKSEPVSHTAIEALLLSVHTGLSVLFQSPTMQLEKAEAEQLAKAAANVSRHYDVPGMSDKVVDWTNLLGTCAMIYGPRIMAARITRAAKKAETVAAKKANSERPPEVAAQNPGFSPSFAFEHAPNL